MALHLAARRVSSVASKALFRNGNLARALSTEVAGDASSGMTLNFNLPHAPIYTGAKVTQVIVPGAAGEFGVTADHTPIVAQLKPGVLQIMFGDGQEAEKYFIPGGFSISHPNSVTVSTALPLTGVSVSMLLGLIYLSFLLLTPYLYLTFQSINRIFLCPMLLSLMTLTLLQ